MSVRPHVRPDNKIRTTTDNMRKNIEITLAVAWWVFLKFFLILLSVLIIFFYIFTTFGDIWKYKDLINKALWNYKLKNNSGEFNFHSSFDCNSNFTWLQCPMEYQRLRYRSSALFCTKGFSLKDVLHMGQVSSLGAQSLQQKLSHSWQNINTISG